MSILGNIKKGVQNSGSNKGKVLYFKDGAKRRIRFLHEIEDGLEITHHDHFDRGVNFFDQEAIKGKRHPLQDDEELRHRTAYVWSVWDYEAKEVKLLLGYANNFSPLPALIGMYESYDTITDRDYVITRTGSQLQTSYTVVPMDKVAFKNKKAKPYSKKKMLEILDKAFPADDDMGSDDENDNEDDYTKMSAKQLYAECVDKGIKAKKDKKKSYYIVLLEEYEDEEDDDEDDDDEEESSEDYEEMSPKELYMECIERGLKAKKKMKKKYYISLLEEDDENDDDEEDWEDDEDEDEEDDW